MTTIGAHANRRNILDVTNVRGLLLSRILSMVRSGAMAFSIPTASFHVGRTILISGVMSTSVGGSLTVPLSRAVARPVSEMSSVNFGGPMTVALGVTAGKLRAMRTPMGLRLSIALPPIFTVDDGSRGIAIASRKLRVRATRSFGRDDSVRFDLLIGDLSFAALRGNCLTLPPARGNNQELGCSTSTDVMNLISVSGTRLDSDVLGANMSLSVTFSVSRVMLGSFANVCNNSVRGVASSFRLKVRSNFTRLRGGKLALTGAGPRLVISLCGAVNIPISIRLSVINHSGRNGTVSASAIILSSLHVGTTSPSTRNGLITSAAH